MRNQGWSGTDLHAVKNQNDNALQQQINSLVELREVSGTMFNGGGIMLNALGQIKIFGLLSSASDRTADPRRFRTARSAVVACLLALTQAVATGCASAPYRTHPELSRRTESIRVVGLLPPAISSFEEQARYKLVPNDNGSRAANETVRAAFRDEMAAQGRPLVLLGDDDPDVKDVSDLFGAVDYTVLRHDFQRGLGNENDEPFPGRDPSFDYTLGPIKELMERHRVDAVWCVIGFNLVPNAWAQAGDAAQYLMAVVTALGNSPVQPMVQMKYELRAALVDKEGQVLFLIRINEGNVSRFPEGPLEEPEPRVGGGETSGPPEEPMPRDLRDPKTARRLVRGLMAEYDKVSGR